MYEYCLFFYLLILLVFYFSRTSADTDGGEEEKAEKEPKVPSEATRKKNERLSARKEYQEFLRTAFPCPHEFCPFLFLTQHGLDKHLARNLSICCRTQEETIVSQFKSSIIAAARPGTDDMQLKREEVFFTAGEISSDFQYTAQTGEILSLPIRLRSYISSASYRVVEVRGVATTPVILGVPVPSIFTSTSSNGSIVVFERKPQTFRTVGLSPGWAFKR